MDTFFYTRYIFAVYNVGSSMQRSGNIYEIFDYIDTIEKPTIENIRVIYKAVNEKYDDLIDMALEPNSKNYKKWVQNMECLKKSENMMIDCIGKKQITDTEWLELMYNIYRYQVKYGGLKYLTIEL